MLDALSVVMKCLHSRDFSIWEEYLETDYEDILFTVLQMKPNNGNNFGNTPGSLVVKIKCSVYFTIKLHVPK